MAEKGFGVKEINLIGPSGTPTIESPNNLNLNANNVAISTNVSIGGTLSVTGNVSVGGTLTYEDVTNIDSVGIVTARAGVVVGDTSNTTFRVHRIQGASATNCGLALNSGGSLNLFTDSSGAGTSRISISAAGNIQFSTFGSTYFLLEDYVTHAGDTNTQYGFDSSDSYVVKTGGSTRLTVNNSGANVVGALTVNGSAISIDPTDSDIQVAYTVTANGSSAYRFAGNGVVSTADNPDLYLIRGQKYRFINNSGGSHPFQIREASGGTAYSTGVTNNGASSGNIDFAPTYDSPAQLVYQCTSHGGMVGNIYLRDAAGNNTNVGVTTLSSSATLHTNRILPVGGAPSGGGGGVIQVAVSRLNSEISDSTSTSFMASGLIVSMTPKFSSSKFHIHMGGGRLKARSGSGIIVKMYVSINGGSYTAAYSGNRGDSFYYSSSGEMQIPVSFVDLYTPSSAPTTIAFQPYWRVFGSPGGGGNTFLESDSNSYGEVVMTVMEVSA